MPGTQTAERPMLVESRTITTVAELLDFCLAAVAAAGVPPADIRMHIPQDMRVTEVTRRDGHKVYDVSVSSAG